MNNRTEPLAIVGMGLRLPGGLDDPASFWEALCRGKDLITEVPADRWDLKSHYHPDPNKPGKVYTKKGGFINNIGNFDPEFFGISPFEASFMDPQQRLMLEVAWEALEDGGIAPEKLAGTKTGVYVGLFMHDYENMHNERFDHRHKGPYSATGTGVSIAANRISYTFDFKGPSAVIDTACSSSLVAVHLACRSLWDGETDACIAGGVNVIFRPESTMVLCKGSFLSPDGCCKSFDESANGYVRADGVCAVVLKRLSDALADKDPIYALIGGSSVNQDGKSKGLTVPDADSQKQAIVEALDKAGMKPDEIQYVETHGTGTPVGDPIEARSIGAVFSGNRPGKNALVIGSVKSNLGHTESAAGIVGLVKAALMLKNGKIPPNLHFITPNPDIPFEELSLRIPTTLEEWPDTGERPKAAGVNSFGFGGTNAHVVLKEYRQEPVIGDDPPQALYDQREKPYIMAVSARSEEALKAAAASYCDYIRHHAQSSDLTLSDICYSSALRKGHHPYRLTLAASTKEALCSLLEGYASGKEEPGIVCGRALQKDKFKLAFVFSGMGQQWKGMGRALYEREPVFRRMIDWCGSLFDRHTGEWSLVEEFLADGDESRIDETHIAQPCIFALQAGLTALWKSWGIQPDFVAGHSVGEVAAYYAAGILTLEDAVKVCFHRSRLQNTKAGMGGMLAAGLSVEAANRYLDGLTDKVSVAAVNAPDSLTLAGDVQALQAIAVRLEKENVFNRFLNVEVAYHSPSMDSILPALKESLQDLTPRTGNIPVISTVTGEWIDGLSVNGDYWADNVRKPVLFDKAFKEIIKMENDLFIEISAHPVLFSYMAGGLAASGKNGTVAYSLKRREDDERVMLSAVAKLYTAGYPIRWEHFYPAESRFVKLPPYPWQRKYYWRETEESRIHRLGIRTGHPLLGRKADSGCDLWHAEIDLNRLPYLNDHVIQGSVVYPAAAFYEAALECCRQATGEKGAVLENVEIKAPLLLNKDMETLIQLVAEGKEKFSVLSRPKDESAGWTLHLQGYFGGSEKDDPAKKGMLEAAKEKCARAVNRDAFYRGFHENGLFYGQHFQGVAEVWAGEDEAVGRISIKYAGETELNDYNIHPALMDACFQVIGACGLKGTFLPVGAKKVTLYQKLGREAWCHVFLTKRTSRLAEATIEIYSPDGGLAAELIGFTYQRTIEKEELQAIAMDEMLYESEWVPDERNAEDRRAGAGFLPDLLPIKDKLRLKIPELTGRYDLERHYQSFIPGINRLCALYGVNALEKLGLAFEQGTTFTVLELMDKYGVMPERKRLLEGLVQMLAEEGLLSKNGDTYRVSAVPASKSCGESWLELMRANAAYRCELSMVEKYGSQLKELLCGETDPLLLAYPRNSQTLEHFYRDSPTFRFYNHVLRELVKWITAALPEGQILRILEIGGGTGGCTDRILPVLPAGRTRYLFTDPSEALLNAAQNKFAKYDFIEYKTFDVQKEPLPQGIDLNAYDLVIACDVFNRMPDAGQALHHVYRATAGGGLLLLVEPAEKMGWYPFIKGQETGRNWENLLAGSGFEETADMLQHAEQGGYEFQVILAKKAGMEAAAGQIDAQGTDELKTGPGAGKDCVVLFADKNGLAEELAGLLASRGGLAPYRIYKGRGFERTGPWTMAINPQMEADYGAALDLICQDGIGTLTIIDMWGVEKAGPEYGSAEIEARTMDNCMAATRILRCLARKEWAAPPALWLVTNGAQPPENEGKLALGQAPLWGLRRVMAAEHPAFGTKMVDLSREAALEELEMLCQEIILPCGEDELVLRGGKRYVQRLKRKPYALLYEKEVPYRLDRIPSKGFDGLYFRAADRKKPGKGQVEIKVHATGVNFKDCLKTANFFERNAAYDSDLASSLGAECAGTVTAVGEAVEAFKAGDAVMGIANDCFASYTVAYAAALIPKPEHLSFEEAAAMPVAYLTAHYALVKLAGIKKGDRVLIHTATGGVGLAAVNIALKAGAEVFATAGNPEKRGFLKAMGIQYAGDSRALKFEDEIMGITKGRGIDIVLNTLPGKAVKKGMGLLKPITGRFIDIANIYNDSLKVHYPEKGISIFTFDLERMMMPLLTGGMWQEVGACLADGTYGAIPFRAFSNADVAEAFKTMGKGAHIGKIVVDFTEPGIVVTPADGKIPISGGGTYLVTGGLSGFGMATARWLAGCGAKNLVLAGRSGASGEAAKAVLDELAQQGVKVAVECVDVAEEGQVAALIKRIDSTMPPLKGVVHAAMVLEDAALTDMDEEKMGKVLGPKLLGAWNLHTHTLDKQLEFFICYSSFTTVIGNAGQGNYVAANSFLESLAEYRRQLGLKALTVCWGAMSGTGYVSRHGAIKEHLRRLGFDGTSLDAAWKAIALGLAAGSAVIGAASVDWRTLARYNPPVYKLPRFSKVIPRDLPEDEGERLEREELLQLPAEERMVQLTKILMREVAGILGIAESGLTPEAPVAGLGIDSLMAVELVIRLEKALAIQLQKMTFLKPGLTIEGLAKIAEAEMLISKTL